MRRPYEVLKKNRLCFGGLGKTHSIKDCKVSPCGISGCDKNHNRLLHEQKGNYRTDVQQQSSNSNSMPASSGFLPILRVTLINPCTGKSMGTCALQDTGSTVTLTDKNLKEMLKLSSKNYRRELSGTNSAISISEKVFSESDNQNTLTV